MTLATALDGLNARLKAGRHRCAVEQRAASLVLRATLPDRVDPSSKRQQRISLNLAATYDSLPEAERLAFELGRQLRSGTFYWEAWDSSQGAAMITTTDFHAAAVKLHATKYRQSPERGKAAWSKKWQPALRKLPPGPISEAVLLRTIRRLPEGSAARLDQGRILAQIAKSLGITHTAILEACRGYGVTSLTPRDIPSDPEIEAVWNLLLPHWRWTWGMCAAYGLRPHECAGLTWLDDDWIEIADDTKTGSRRVTPCPREWVSTWGLRELPRPTQSRLAITNSLAETLRGKGISIKPYALRHAYALRLLSRGVPADLAARLMGHSLAVHQQTYQRWIEADRIQKAMQGMQDRL